MYYRPKKVFMLSLLTLLLISMILINIVTVSEFIKTIYNLKTFQEILQWAERKEGGSFKGTPFSNGIAVISFIMFDILSFRFILINFVNFIYDSKS